MRCGHPAYSLSSAYRQYGQFTARLPIPLLLLLNFVFPILICAVLTYGMKYKVGIKGAEILFTPSDAPYKKEELYIKEYWGAESGKYLPGKDWIRRKTTFLTITSSDGGSVLRKEHALAVQDFLHFVSDDITATVEEGGEERNITYQDVCLPWRGHCFENSHVHMISRAYSANRTRIRVTHPLFKPPFQEEGIYLDSILGGVVKNETDDIIITAKAWLVLYEIYSKPDERANLSGHWELALEREIRDHNYSRLLSVSFLHSQTFEMELAQNAHQVVPRMALAFLLLVVFSVLCSFKFVNVRIGESTPVPTIDWVESKPLLALLAVVTAGMGVTSSYGLLHFLGVPFTDIISVMPFLAVAIGVDNMFLFLNCWRESGKADEVDGHPSVEERIGDTMSHAAVSITITSLTDALSFGIGASTPILGVRLFCGYSAVAIVMTFFYQMTMMVGAMVLFGKQEHAGRHSLFFFVVSIPTRAPKKVKQFLSLILGRPEYHESNRDLFSRMLYQYAGMVVNPLFKVFTVFALGVYLAGAIYGMTIIPIGFRFRNLLVGDSPTIEFYEVRDKYFPTVNNDVSIVVSNATDLSNPEERERVFNMVESFANSSYTVEYDEDDELEPVHFWLYGYRKFLWRAFYMDYFPPDPKMFYIHLHNFLLSRDDYEYDIVFDPKDDNRIITYRFTVRFHKTDSNLEKIEAATWYRKTAKEWSPDFHLTTFSDVWPYVDQYSNVRPTTMLNIGLALVCMLVVALLLLPNFSCALWVCATMVSIEIGVIGYMSHWGVALDCISMITIVMSLGFSVDFAAHITYGYLTAEGHDPREKLAVSLETVALPCLQGAFSTITGLVVLANIEAYMVQTFVKTVVLIMIFGVIHALVFLPAALTISCSRAIPAQKKLTNVHAARPPIPGNFGKPPVVYPIPQQGQAMWSGPSSARS